jgi:hypothetical protein
VRNSMIERSRRLMKLMCGSESGEGDEGLPSFMPHIDIK